jgi:hypothetical protein
MYKKRDMITKIVAIVILLGLVGSVFAAALI